MLGFSVYLSQINEAYVHQMINRGFNTIFTSLQIPEEVHLDKFAKLRALKQLVGQDVTIIVDINPGLFDFIESEIGCDKWSGLDAIRFDESVDITRIMNWGMHSKVVLNASTDGLNILRTLSGNNFDCSNVVVMHNYYPRPETGLDSEYFSKQNNALKYKFPNVQIMAFICGTELRGPVYKGLPTLEDHRVIHPLIAYKSLQKAQVDLVVVGDLRISEMIVDQLEEWVSNECVLLRAKLIDKYHYLYDVVQNNRQDIARDVIRSEFHRKNYHHEVNPHNCISRPKGTITVDNQLYGRYMNELQITKKDLPENEAVNVIGSIIEEDLPLIELIGSGTKFKFVKE
ncbi:DUF871 domain-containing protein [Macrococcoides goetzii]|nr:MupG family TIM beta-alpha barrel fold protein [Macrococcus goetzii]TDM41565.1 DUF871 domain-containing protein [Macrococcus goetzii]